MLKLKYFGHLMRRTDSLKKTLMLGKIKGRRGDDREWDGWIASPTQRTWVWASSGSWWWTGKPGVLQSMGLQSQTRLSDEHTHSGIMAIVGISLFSEGKDQNYSHLSHTSQRFESQGLFVLKTRVINSLKPKQTASAFQDHLGPRRWGLGDFQMDCKTIHWYLHNENKCFS